MKDMIAVLAIALVPALTVLWIRRPRKVVDYTPRHAATPAEVAKIHRAAVEARIEAERAAARREAQARLDAEGLPRYAYDVAFDKPELSA